MCGNRSDAISLIVSKCCKLAQKHCERRHSNMANFIQWYLLEKFGLKTDLKWYKHEPGGILEFNVTP